MADFSESDDNVEDVIGQALELEDPDRSFAEVTDVTDDVEEIYRGFFKGKKQNM